MKIPGKSIKEFALIAFSLIYLLNSFKIGFWITGDMHSGGPFAGLILFPFFLAIATLALFWKETRIRTYSLIVITTYLLAAFVLTVLVWKSN